MTKRTQRFVILSVTTLLVGLGTGMVASYVGLPNLGIVGNNGPAELAYVPADAAAVAFADVRHVMDSELRQKLVQLSPGAAPGADQFKDETGIDIQTDVDRIVAAVNSGAPANARPLMLVRGRFDKVRIETAIHAKGGQTTDYNGHRLITVENELALAFVEADLAVVGTPASVRQAIDTKASGNNVTSNDTMMRLVKESESGNAWAVAEFATLTAGHALPVEISQQLPQITWLAITGRINDGVSAVVRAEARDEVAANNLRDVIRGFVALARMQAGQHAQFADLVNSLELGGQGTTVTLGFAVPAAMIDMLSVLKQQHQQPQPEAAPEASAPQQPAAPSL